MVRSTSFDATRADSELVHLADGAGSILVGWVAPGVLYTRAGGVLSAELGTRYAARVKQFLDEVPRLAYFSDARDVKEYDLLARSAFLRTALAARRKFSTLVILSWVGDFEAESRIFSEAFGNAASLLMLPEHFEARLFEAAPLARCLLEPARPRPERALPSLEADRSPVARITKLR